MIKYHVKFKHQYQIPQQSGIEFVTETVDDEWEFEEWVNIFTYIYSNYQVVGSVTVTIMSTAEIRELNYD